MIFVRDLATASTDISIESETGAEAVGQLSAAARIEPPAGAIYPSKLTFCDAFLIGVFTVLSKRTGPRQMDWMLLRCRFLCEAFLLHGATRQPLSFPRGS